MKVQFKPRRSFRTVLTLFLLLSFRPAGYTQAVETGEAERIDQYMTRWHQIGRFNGSALVARDGQVILKKGYGFANLEWGVPNRTDTRFRLYSISKQFTTVLLFQLAAEGKINLDGKLTDYLPAYRKDTGNRVTLDQLLRHTAGIPCYINDARQRPQGKPAYKWDGHYEREAFIRDFLSEDLLFEPGSRYKYSNTGYFLLALVAEKVTGQTYAENLQKRFFDPLGMKNSGVDSDLRIITGRADGYEKAAGGYRNTSYINPDNLLGAGNVYSTVEDLFVWNQALETSKLLPGEWRNRMASVYWKEPQQEHAYSLNYFTRRLPSGDTIRYTGFSGGGPGFNTDAFRFLDTGLIVILLDNSTQYNHWKIAPDIHEIMAGREPDPPKPLVSDVLADLVTKEGRRAALARYEVIKNKTDQFDSGALESELNSLAYNTMKIGDLANALELFRFNVELFPDSWNTHDSLGEALLATGDRARSDQSHAVAREIRERETAMMRSLESGDFEEATKIVIQAHAKSPIAQLLQSSIVGPLFEKMMMEKNYDKALKLCRLWALANPGTVGPYYSMARIYRTLGESGKEKECLQKILEIEPDGPGSATARKALGIPVKKFKPAGS
jgi:CubicO group peptidase (beta-lactamase class C family)